jgi:hypothetical protein
MADSGTAGYFGGGIDAVTILLHIDKITFPADTKSTLAATLTPGRGYHAAMANSGTAGYFGGGVGTGGSTYFSAIDKITFAADTRSTLTATLSSVRAYQAGIANSGTAGYFGGGFQFPGNFLLSGIDKITFASDSKSTLSATLTTARNNHAGMANSGTAGYFGGGEDSGGKISGIDKIAFPADTKSTLAATLSTARFQLAAMANSGTAGYFGGGYDSDYISGIDKITFPADTKSTLAATLTMARAAFAAMANSGVL